MLLSEKRGGISWMDILPGDCLSAKCLAPRGRVKQPINLATNSWQASVGFFGFLLLLRRSYPKATIRTPSPAYAPLACVYKCMAYRLHTCIYNVLFYVASINRERERVCFARVY